MANSITSTLKRLKPWMLPIAIALGMIFHNVAGKLTFLSPYLIFLMLFITFCRINPREIKITRLSPALLSIQILGSLAAYYILRSYDVAVAQGMMICILCPTATAAPVITGMLGGSVPRLVTYSLVSNLAVALLCPFILPEVSGHEMGVGEMAESFRHIASSIIPLIILPLVVAMVFRRVAPKIHQMVSTHQSVGFYMWAVSLLIVVGSAVSFVMSEPWERVPEMIVLALGAGVACALQFFAGRRIGGLCGDKIAGAQGLGQKNTILAIWIALTYLDPISSVAPAAYIAWQNTFNSIQIYLHERAMRNA